MLLEVVGGCSTTSTVGHAERGKVVGTCYDGNPQTRWWVLEMKGAIKLKKSYRACVALGTLEAADRYQQSHIPFSCFCARVIDEAKSYVLEEFSEAMEKDCLKVVRNPKFLKALGCPG